MIENHMAMYDPDEWHERNKPKRRRSEPVLVECGDCGSTICEDDDIYYFEGNYVCESCAQDRATDWMLDHLRRLA